MYYSHIITDSYVDGPNGPRTVLFMQGCDRHCPGCQNEHLWPFTTGQEMRADHVAHKLIATDQPITISGGEPFAQPSELSNLLQMISTLDRYRHVIVYSGYTWKELVTSHRPHVLSALVNCDILVDGRYIRSLDHDYLQWRGSSNQRPIRVPETIANDRLVIADWDTQILTVTDDGSLIGTAGMINDLGGGCQTRRCGQTTH